MAEKRREYPEFEPDLTETGVDPSEGHDPGVEDDWLMCRQCLDWKPPEEFDLKSRKPGRKAFQSWCRDCQNRAKGIKALEKRAKRLHDPDIMGPMPEDHSGFIREPMSTSDYIDLMDEIQQSAPSASRSARMSAFLQRSGMDERIIHKLLVNLSQAKLYVFDKQAELVKTYNDPQAQKFVVDTLCKILGFYFQPKKENIEVSQVVQQFDSKIKKMEDEGVNRLKARKMQKIGEDRAKELLAAFRGKSVEEIEQEESGESPDGGSDNGNGKPDDNPGPQEPSVS